MLMGDTGRIPRACARARRRKGEIRGRVHLLDLEARRRGRGRSKAMRRVSNGCATARAILGSPTVYLTLKRTLLRKPVLSSY